MGDDVQFDFDTLLAEDPQRVLERENAANMIQVMPTGLTVFFSWEPSITVDGIVTVLGRTDGTVSTLLPVFSRHLNSFFCRKRKKFRKKEKKPLRRKFVYGGR